MPVPAEIDSNIENVGLGHAGAFNLVNEWFTSLLFHEISP